MSRSQAATSDNVLDYIPGLRIFARSLTRDIPNADDLVQETLLKALSNIDSYQPGTSMKAWLSTIMRNSFYTEQKRRGRFSTSGEDGALEDASIVLHHEVQIDSRRVLQAVLKLPLHYREPLVLVTIAGHSYEEAASICGINIGTVKSRISRARASLEREFGPASELLQV